MIVSLYTIFPALILHASAAGHLRRKKVRAAVWVLIAALLVTSFSLFLAIWYDEWTQFVRKEGDVFHDADVVVSLVNDHTTSNFEQVIWELVCMDMRDLDYATDGLIAGFSALAFFVLLYLLFVRNVLRIPWFDAEQHKFFAHLREHWWAISGSLALLPVWALSIGFWLTRNRIDRNSGSMNQDHEWIFGQWLAMATWAPVLFCWREQRSLV